MRDVFISYSTKDMAVAENVRRIMETNGLQCWMAPEDIPGGSNYAREIPRAIRACQVFLLILSKNAQESNWVVKELDNAVNSGKIIMPLMLEDCPLNDEFNFLLTGTQRYTAYRKSEETLSVLVKQIQAVVGVTAPVKESPVAEIPAAEGKTPIFKAMDENILLESVQPETKAPEKEIKPAFQHQTGPVIRTAKPVKVRPKKIRAPFTLGKTEALATPVILLMPVLSVLAYLLGNKHFFGWQFVSLYSNDERIISYFLVTALLMGAAMWLEWVRFRHREQMQNPEAPDCPACGSNQLRAYTFRTRRLTGKEWLTLVLIPVCAVLGVFCQPLVKVLCGAVMNVHYLDTQEYAMAHAGLVQGLVIGLWLANLAVRYLRRKAGLRSTVFRCNQCRATFLPLGRNR